jgi:hypothetical protein
MSPKAHEIQIISIYHLKQAAARTNTVQSTNYFIK